VVVAWSENMAVRRVVKQLPVEMLQHVRVCGSALWWRSTTPYVNIPRLFFLNDPKQFLLVFLNTLLTLMWSLVAWIPPSSIFSLPRKQFPSVFW
jgi:hypothetical protein